MPSAGEVTVTRPVVGLSAILCPTGPFAIDADITFGYGGSGPAPCHPSSRARKKLPESRPILA